VRFHGNLTENGVKLTEKTASVLVSFMKKGFYATYTLTTTENGNPLSKYASMIPKIIME